jgi:hypothetical protein
MESITYAFNDCLRRWNYVESYNNSYANIYNEITSKTPEELEIELANIHSDLRQKILQYYSIIDHNKKYNLTRAYIEIQTKMNIIMVEKLLFDRTFSEFLSPNWRAVFKENGYDGLYQLARKETVEEIDRLTKKQLEWLLQ